MVMAGSKKKHNGRPSYVEIIKETYPTIVLVTQQWREFWENRNQRMCDNLNTIYNLRCVKRANHTNHGTKHEFVSDKIRVKW